MVRIRGWSRAGGSQGTSQMGSTLPVGSPPTGQGSAICEVDPKAQNHLIQGSSKVSTVPRLFHSRSWWSLERWSLSSGANSRDTTWRVPSHPWVACTCRPTHRPCCRNGSLAWCCPFLKILEICDWIRENGKIEWNLEGNRFKVATAIGICDVYTFFRRSLFLNITYIA